MSSSRFVWMGSSGCLLPMLIIFNLFFGKLIFNSTRLWLGIEAVLILIFILKINALATKISQQFGQQGRGSRKSKGKVIDVEGEVVEEKQKLQ